MRCSDRFPAMMRAAVVSWSLLVAAADLPLARADVRLPALFTDHMVLQQGQTNRVWGWAAAGEAVTVSIAGQTHPVQAGDDGRWQVTLEPLPVTRAPDALTLTVQGANTVTVRDVLVGEVWICSGQSNMAWTVGQANDPDLETRTANFPQIRLISVPQVGTQEPQSDFRGQWEVCSPETVGQFSAVGYFFGRQLHQTLDVPIGLIDNAWGGSACEAWIRRDLLAADKRFAPLLERWTQTEQEFEPAKMQAAYEQKLADWNKQLEQAKAAGQPLPPKPRPAANPLTGNARPGNIYNGVLKPTIGYGIRGAIWYQGESNAGRAHQYADLFPLMIESWRDEWGQGSFPFYWVQLADFRDERPEPVDSDWAELREAQTLTMSRLPATGQAVIIDLGEGQDIHPRNKQDVAKRLARWALARDYGIKGIEYRSPEFRAIARTGGKVLLTFDFVGGGLQTFDQREPVGFAIAGSDQKFVWAKARIVGKDQVEVWSDQVPEPMAVRYAWSDNPVCNLYNKAGLPVTPFRTDGWPGVTAAAFR